MKNGDFASVVQLGVGLHVGTALLQLYSELGLQPIDRVLDRIRSLYQMPQTDQPSAELFEELTLVESQYEIFKIQFFSEYRYLIVINSVIACILAVVLIAFGFVAQYDIDDGYEWIPIFACALSILPAPASLGSLWHEANQRLTPIKKLADALETKCLER